MAAQPDALLTAAEYEDLPEVLGFRDELIEGERVLSPSAKKVHTIVIENLEGILKQQIRNGHVIRESGWYFQLGSGRESVPSPDLMVLSPQDYDNTPLDQWFRGKPLFVVEVISPSERKSKRLQKVGIYLEAGTGAVVEVDAVKRSVITYKPDSDTPEIIRSGHIDWPFVATFDQIFARL